MSLMAFLLSLGVSCRITRFITKDTLAADLRSWVADRFGEESKPAYLITCGWCSSIWVAAAVTPFAYWAGDTVWFQVSAMILTLSYLTGLASSWLD
ncbi:hypothetical protein ABZW18_26910 [Streptomyces sp. NPDC004647]|uniref:hypothetical protein n=1 Tax=Streptomyces sp. NPDC004647 TaxID=3154671 RepID=UPI0033A3B56A